MEISLSTSLPDWIVIATLIALTIWMLAIASQKIVELAVSYVDWRLRLERHRSSAIDTEEGAPE